MTLDPRPRLRAELDAAPTYEAWRIAAEALDRAESIDPETSPIAGTFYDAALMQRHTRRLDDLRRSGFIVELESTLTESLHRHLPDLGASALYAQRYTGEPDHTVRRWLDTCESTLYWLRDVPMPGIPLAERRARFEQAAANLGRSALMLSGGGAWGLYHLGVVRALLLQGLLPRVVCGSSMGAIVAAGVGVRTDEELRAMVDDPRQIHRVAVRARPRAQWVRARTVLDPEQLREHVEANTGGWTFGEAHRRTGRILNVSISPTRARQKPRILSHATAADVLISDATVASCSIPGLWPSVELRAKAADGSVVPYAPAERWVDGSFQGDVPLRRMARLHNVNHFIVSQANPFVLPFVIQQHHGVLDRGARLGGALVRAQLAALLEETRRRVQQPVLRPLLDTAHAIAGQSYGGDIDIHPRVPPSRYLRVMANPSLDELRAYILGGERATWPRIAMIRDQTRIVRAIEACVEALRPDGPTTS
jgi:TAG lipase/steryl ester hydrolase/phospholipase A2/LPA acyltransferase